jgi:hypothetical protein
LRGPPSAFAGADWEIEVPDEFKNPDKPYTDHEVEKLKEWWEKLKEELDKRETKATDAAREARRRSRFPPVIHLSPWSPTIKAAIIRLRGAQIYRAIEALMLYTLVWPPDTFTKKFLDCQLTVSDFLQALYYFYKEQGAQVVDATRAPPPNAAAAGVDAKTDFGKDLRKALLKVYLDALQREVNLALESENPKPPDNR